MTLWYNRRFFLRTWWPTLLWVAGTILFSSLFVFGVWHPEPLHERVLCWVAVATVPILVWAAARHMIRPQVSINQDSVRWHTLGWQRKGQAPHSAISGLSVAVREDIPILQLNVTDPPLYLEFPIEGEAAQLESEIRALTGVADPAIPGQNTWHDAPW